MTYYYVKNSGSDTTGDGASWGTAWATVKKAVDTVTAGDHTIFCHQETESPALSVDTTYAPAAGVKIVGSNDSANAPPQTLGTRTIDGSGTTGVDITISSGYWYGIIFKNGGSTTAASFTLASTDNSVLEFENCGFTVSNNNSSSLFTIGSSVNSRLLTRGCTFTWGGTGQGFVLRSNWESYGDDFCGGATVPTTLFESYNSGFNYVRIEGGDLGDITGTLFAANVTTHMRCEIYGSKIAAATILASLSNDANGEVFIYDCSYMNGSTLTGILFAHYNYLGNTVCTTSPYWTTGGALPDGTNPVTWVVTSANGTLGVPYRSPWIEVYHSGTSAITPYLEILRDSAIAVNRYNDDEVWAEWEYKATGDSARVSFADDRRALLVAAAAQAAGAGLGSWTGEASAESESMKIDTGSAITPAEVGYLRARVCVTGTVAVHVDPTIRGRT